LSLLTLVQVEDSLSILAMFRRHVLDAVDGSTPNLRRSEDYDRGCARRVPDSGSPSTRSRSVGTDAGPTASRRTKC
jgi:hypothetical protein